MAADPGGNVEVIVTRSAGSDGAVLVFVDNHGDLPVRVVLNDAQVLGVPYQHTEPPREAPERRLAVDYGDLAYPAGQPAGGGS